MRAMILREFNKPLVLGDIPIPTIGDGDLLMRVKRCGVCYTDIKVASGLAPDISLPRILGHEVAGEVASVGKGVKYVFLTPARSRRPEPISNIVAGRGCLLITGYHQFHS